MGRKAVYQSEEERINARRAKQKEYYNRTKDSKRELFSLRALRRYYTKKINEPNNPKLEKHQRRLDEVNSRIASFHSAQLTPFVKISEYNTTSEPQTQS